MPLTLALLLLGCRPTPLPPPAVPAAEPVVPLVSELPADARARYLEAAVAERRGDIDRAEANLRWVTRLDADSPWPWLALGRFLERQRRWDEAIGVYQRAITRDEALADAHLALGTCLVRRGRAVDARPHLARASELGLPQGHHLYARALIMTGLRDEAVGVLRRWRDEPLDSDDALDRARLSYELGDDDGAMDDLLQADWLVAPAIAGDLLLDAARRSCRLGDAWTLSEGQSFASRVDPAWADVAERIATAAGEGKRLAVCAVAEVPPGCEGLDEARAAWQIYPQRPSVLDDLEDRARACGDEATQEEVARMRRWLLP